MQGQTGLLHNRSNNKKKKITFEKESNIVCGKEMLLFEKSVRINRMDGRRIFTTYLYIANGDLLVLERDSYVKRHWCRNLSLRYV